MSTFGRRIVPTQSSFSFVFFQIPEEWNLCSSFNNICNTFNCVSCLHIFSHAPPAPCARLSRSDSSAVRSFIRNQSIPFLFSLHSTCRFALSVCRLRRIAARCSACRRRATLARRRIVAKSTLLLCLSRRHLRCRICQCPFLLFFLLLLTHMGVLQENLSAMVRSLIDSQSLVSFVVLCVFCLPNVIFFRSAIVPNGLAILPNDLCLRGRTLHRGGRRVLKRTYCRLTRVPSRFLHACSACVVSTISATRAS